MNSRATFIGHNIQHIAKSVYFKDHQIIFENFKEQIFIWNGMEKSRKELLARFDFVIDISVTNFFKKIIRPFLYEGKYFKLNGDFEMYNDLDIEDWIFIYSDEVIHTIRFLDLLKNLKNKKYHIILLDEGTGLYSNRKRKYPNNLKYLVKKRILGLPVPQSSYIGWRKEIECVVAQYPNRLPRKLCLGKEVRKEPEIWSDFTYWKKWLSELGIKDTTNKNDLVLYLGTADEYLKYEHKIIDNLISIVGEERLVIKPHPRADKKTYQKYINTKCIVLSESIVRMIPAEIFCYILMPQIVVTLSSSALDSIVAIHKNIMGIFLYQIYGKEEECIRYFNEVVAMYPNLISVTNNEELIKGLTKQDGKSIGQ